MGIRFWKLFSSYCIHSHHIHSNTFFFHLAFDIENEYQNRVASSMHNPDEFIANQKKR